MTMPWNSSATSMTRSSTGSISLAVDLLRDDLGPRDLQLVALAPHHLDQDRQLQLAAADDLHLLGRLGRLDADRDVAEQLLVEPVLDLPRGDELAVAAGERRGVDAEDHRHRRLVDGDRRQRPCGFSASAIVSPIMMSSMPARQTMSPAAASFDVDALQPVERVELGDLASRWIVPSSLQTATGSPTLTRAVEDRGRSRGGRGSRWSRGSRPAPAAAPSAIAARRRHVLDDRRRTAAAGPRPASPGRRRRGAGRGAGVEDREVELVLGGVEVDEQVVDLVQHFLDARVGAVDLVDDDDRRQPALERLAQHEPRLRQRTLPTRRPAA